MKKPVSVAVLEGKIVLGVLMLALTGAIVGITLWLVDEQNSRAEAAVVETGAQTETAAAAVPRLIDLGLEPFLLRSTLRGVIGQRLVRVLCERCKRSRRLSAADLASDPRFAAIGFRAGEMITDPVGCERCGGTGYRGRQGVYEILEVTDEVRPLIDGKHDSTIVDDAARRSGMTTMLDDALAKCRAGLTSPAEALRVVALR